jgi:hypothetical protein
MTPTTVTKTQRVQTIEQAHVLFGSVLLLLVFCLSGWR